MCVCVCGSVHDVKYVCVRNKSVCSCVYKRLTGIDGANMGRDKSPCCNWRPGNGENALSAVRAVSAWAAGNATRTRRGHTIRCPVLQVQRRPARQPTFFCRTLPFTSRTPQQGLGILQVKFNFPRMRSKIGNESMQSTTAQNIHHGSNRHRYSNALRKQFCYPVTIVAYKL